MLVILIDVSTIHPPVSLSLPFRWQMHVKTWQTPLMTLNHSHRQWVTLRTWVVARSCPLGHEWRSLTNASGTKLGWTARRTPSVLICPRTGGKCSGLPHPWGIRRCAGVPVSVFVSVSLAVSLRLLFLYWSLSVYLFISLTLELAVSVSLPLSLTLCLCPLLSLVDKVYFYYLVFVAFGLVLQIMKIMFTHDWHLAHAWV